MRHFALSWGGRVGFAWGWILLVLSQSALGESLNLTVNPSSNLTLTFNLPELMRSNSVTTSVSGTLAQNLTFGTQGSFGTVATSGQLTGGTLSLGNASNVVVNLEILGQIAFSSSGLKLTSSGPSNPFTSPPLANGTTRVPLTGASLVLNMGSISTVASGLVGGQVGNNTFNFSAANTVTLPFPSGAYMDVTVSGTTVTESIPLNLSGVFQPSPLNYSLGLSGTLNLTGTRTLPVETPVAVASLENKDIFQRAVGGAWSVFADSTDGLFTPFDNAYDSAGNLYVTDILKSKVFKFTPAGVGSTFADAADGAVTPTSLAIDGSGNVFVTNYLTNTIAKVNSAGVGTPFAGPAQGLNSPFGVAVDSTGNLYVANLASKGILKITPAGASSVFADSTDGLFTPLDVAVDSSNNVYVADALLSKVFKFTPAGVGSVFADLADGLTTPSGLAFDAAGNLLVTNYLSNKVVTVTPGGVGSLYADASVGFKSPFGIAAKPAGAAASGFSAVPEPASWALAASGLLALGLVARRRQG